MALERSRGITGAWSFLWFVTAVLVTVILSGCFLLDLFEPEKLDAPSISEVYQISDISKIHIAWNWVDGAENFELWARDATAGGDFRQILWGGVSDFNYEGWEFPVLPAHTYEFKVRAHRDEGGYSEFSAVVPYRVPDFRTPTGLTATAISGVIQVSWGALETVSYYELERAVDTTANWASLPDIYSGTQYSDSDVVAGITYWYRVSGYSSKFSPSSTEWSEARSAKAVGTFPAPEVLTATQGGTTASVRLDWPATADAEEFRIYRLKEGLGDVGEPGDYTLINNDWGLPAGTSGGTTYYWYDNGTVGGLDYGVRYYYRVRARMQVTTGVYAESGYSPAAEGWWGILAAVPSAPQDLQAAKSDWANGYIYVSWGAVTGATSYDIYRCAMSAAIDPNTGPEDADFLILANGTSITATHFYEYEYQGGYDQYRAYFYRAKAMNLHGASVFSNYDSGYDGTPTAPASPPATVTASEGSYSNAIVIGWSSANNAQWYRVYRHGGNPSYITDDQAISNWITGTSFVDYSPGIDQEYYKVKAMHAWGGTTSFSIAATGWTDSGSAPYGSTYSISGTVADESTLSGLAGVTVDLTGGPSAPDPTTTGGDGNYSFIGVDPGTYTVTPSLTDYTFTPADAEVIVTAADVTGVDFEGAAAAVTVPYDWTDLGAVLTVGAGIGFSEYALELAVDASVPYVGYFRRGDTDDYAGVMEYDGTWSGADGTAAGELPSALYAVTGDDISLAVGSDSVFMMATDYTDVYIHETDGTSWSANLAGDYFGTPGEHDDRATRVRLAVHGGELYAAQVPVAEVGVNNVKVSRYDDGASEWVHVGGDTETGLITSSGGVWDVLLKEIDGTLYLAYSEDSDDSATNEWITIMHWSGSSWERDLEWNQEDVYLSDFDVAGSDIYLLCDTADMENFAGGVFRKTDALSAESILEAGMLSPHRIAADAAGNLIMLSTKYELVSADPPTFEISRLLSVFDGSNWAEIEGDYSDCASIGAICADGTDIYYVYGSEASQADEYSPPQTLKAQKLSLP